MTVEGRISLSELGKTKRTHLSLLVDKCINHKNGTADKLKKTFSVITSLLEQITEHFIHLSSYSHKLLAKIEPAALCARRFSTHTT